ncbi:MAG: hypothetical protein P4L81_03175 [Candidatus Pacebacteria bacterium]|nr:hypothetical protein [Candidatus Paceibacterota bacterium]
MAAKTFDAAALAVVAQGLKEEEIPFAVREFRISLDRVIRSIENLGANPQEFAGRHRDQDDPVWKLARHFAGKQPVRCCDHVFTELRTFRNRLKRLRTQNQTEYDVAMIVATADFIDASELFLEPV